MEFAPHYPVDDYHGDMVLFSRTKKTKPDTLRYSFAENVRTRILLAFKHLSESDHSPNGSFESLLDDLQGTLAREYGGLVQSEHHSGMQPILEHFINCSDAQVVDFIQMAFRSCYYRAEQTGVDEINRILREEAIGYEFTDHVTRHVDKPDTSYMGGGRVRTFIEHDYPDVIVKRDEYAHGSIVKPCLTVLAKPAFKVANTEMLKAHEHIRKDAAEDAITCCCAAYESVMKTILDTRNLPYSSTDTCAPLVDACIRGGLLPGFYADVLKAPGQIRNKISSAHGRGPKKAHSVDPQCVDHMVQIASANILLLVKYAKM